ncbi:winged helix DNA-binding protein [Nakamurella sp. YIM 132087]|uniref:Winged helix DNA-binding protein n=1 Tax=Nakamurella alba TaxID=2665158 RepID=A0A7K1FQG2_9ACTN|nr:MarR family transcriptional regulator [Nakamurella alba]MTD16392.1 winged helix DNA-binding protein [Nakamurella alba]
MPPTAPQAGLACDLFVLLESLGRRLACGGSTAALDVLVDRDLSFSQVRCLLSLAMDDHELPIHKLAEQLRLSVAAAGRNVDHLVREGLLEREEDAADRRTKLVSLSADGRKLMAEFAFARQDSVVALLDRLDEADLRRLHAALGPVLTGLDGLSPEPADLVITTDPTATTDSTAITATDTDLEVPA